MVESWTNPFLYEFPCTAELNVIHLEKSVELIFHVAGALNGLSKCIAQFSRLESRPAHPSKYSAPNCLSTPIMSIKGECHSQN